MAIDVEKELAEANARLPVDLSNTADRAPIEMQMRVIALTIAQRHVGDTVVKEGALYNALKMDNKIIKAVTVDDVITVALVFERYLWGEWSKGIAENALDHVLTEAADVLEKKFRKGPPDDSDEEEPPIGPSEGGTTP